MHHRLFRLSFVLSSIKECASVTVSVEGRNKRRVVNYAYRRKGSTKVHFNRTWEGDVLSWSVQNATVFIRST